MEQENNKNEVDTTAVDLAEASEKKKPISKAKSDIVKSMAKNFLKTRKANVSSEGPRKKQKKKSKSVSEGGKATENDVEKLNSVEENQQKKKSKSISESNKATENDVKKLTILEENQQKDATTSVEQAEKSLQIQKNEENNISAADSKEKITKSQNDPKKQRNGEESGPSNNNKNEEKREGNRRRKRNEQDTSNSVKNNSNEEKHNGRKNKQEIQKKEKIDGLIFMCNAKTKTDCFRYRVLGLSAGKKDLVLGIRPGLKLFLYDYDLRLMYGIYKATSAGGMKLEPEAFGGAFPAQVRFSFHANCLPLVESIFKKAIKENYNEKNKFKFELSARQVRKLTELFRPVHSTAPSFHSPSRASARIFEHPEKREVHDRPRDARAPSHRDASHRDPYANISARGFAFLPHDRDQLAAYGESASTKREDGDGHRDLYLSEKEYRAYGLQVERRNLNPQHHITPTLTSYLGDHREPALQQPYTVPSNPHYLTEREYRTYDSGATREGQSIVSAATGNISLAGDYIMGSYIADPYYGRYSGDPLVDAYLPRPGATHLIESDHLRENQADRLHSAYRFDALANTNQMHHHRDLKPAYASTSVSSRYSFGGVYRL